MRLIPGKTKVHVELFRGVTIGDVVIGAVALAMLIFVLISNLPWKLGICIAVFALAVLLLLRIDEQPNYIYFLHILSFLGYKRRFGRLYTDRMLTEAGEKDRMEAAADTLYGGETEIATGGGDAKREARKSERQQRKAEKSRAREEERQRRREDRLLSSRRTPEEVKQAILDKRSAQAQESMIASFRRSAGAPKGEAPMTKAERRALRREEDRVLRSKTATDEEKNEILKRRAEAGQESARRAAEVRDAERKRSPMSEIIGVTGIRDGFIEYLNRSYYGAALEISPVEFRFFSPHRRDNSIENCLGRILRSVHAGYSANIVKLERPIMYDRYLDREYGKLEELRTSYENGMLSEAELQSRVEIEYDRINELRALSSDSRVITPFYYLVLFESDKRQLEVEIKEAEQLLTNGELTVSRLDDTGLAVFLKYTNQLDFDERDVNLIRPEDLHLWAQPETVDIRVRRVEVNHIVTHNLRVVNYPTMVGDAWLAGVMSLPGTKVVVKCRPMDRTKAIRNIDRSLQELRGQESATTVDSKRLEIGTHISTLQELLATLQSDAESLLECNIYITAYDIVATRSNLRIPQPPESELPTVNEMKKNIRRAWQEGGFRLNNMEFDQVQAFIGSQVSALDPLAAEGRGISSNTVAACYPWIFAHFSDEGGVKLGESDGIPVFIDFFRRDSERVNSNMVIVGKSGSGKSYATKSLLANLAAEDAKIFILDPENEYTELAGNLHGQIINVGNAQYGRLNPFHIITALDDDEAGISGPSGSYATHLQFLEEFFRQIMPDCGKDAMEYLNTLVDHMYLTRDITAETDLSRLGPEDYPVFDDLYDQILQEFQANDNPFTRDMLRTLMNYVAKFSTGGRNANIWNGPSTVTTDENFTVFNFQSMLANRNQTVANAQMLLVLKYIDNEIIKNRDYNSRYRANRKIVVVIDEAHVFIDAKYPIALDFMFQLAKRIRKYNGMQIVITQNIKDFVGSEELARKSTAIINACQYSFIFSLAPNDIQDLVKLYENAGGINENEREQIVQAPRGQAFTILSPAARSTFRVETAPGIAEMFEERDYVSGYFSGTEGAENWEEFVSASREAHALAMSARSRQEIFPAFTGEDLPSDDDFNFADELFALPELEGETAAEPTETASGVRFRISEQGFGEETPVPAEEPEAPVAEEPGASAVDIPAPDSMIGMLATAISKMADAVDRIGTPRTQAAPEQTAEGQILPPQMTELPAPEESEDGGDDRILEVYEQFQQMQLEKDEEIRRLRTELEELRAHAEMAVQNGPETDGEMEGSPEADAPQESPEVSAAFEPAAGEDYSQEDDSLSGVFDGEAPGSGENEEQEYEGEEDEEEYQDEEDEEDEDDLDYDFSEEDDTSFLDMIFSYAEEIGKMSPFERMEANGVDVMEFTLEDLAAETEAWPSRRRASAP